MQLFKRNVDPVFLKEESQATEQLEHLKALRDSLNKEGQKQIDQQIKFLEYGIAGEENIAFELKNSHMLMYVLKDIYLEFDGLSAQIDYLVFTRKHCYVIECKNLYGHIEINSNGDFLRLLSFNGRKKKEGMYSPITQNQRHIDLIKKIVIDRKNNFIMKFVADKVFDDYYKPLVVLANPKTVIHKKYAKKDIRDQVIRSDQLIAFIETMDKQSTELPLSEKEVAAQAQYFLTLHQENEKDYTKRYDAYKVGVTTETSIEDSKLYDVLKKYRLLKSREEMIKPYYIYTNNQLDNLIRKMPRTKKDLLQVEGFGKIKVEKYGDDILHLITQYLKYIRVI